MTKLLSRMSDPSVKLAIALVGFVAVLDFSLRLMPTFPEVNARRGDVTDDIFARRLPTAQWATWYEDSKASEALEILRAREREEKAEAEAKAKIEARKKPPEVSVDRQQGDISVLRVDGLRYQLWGVFNKGSYKANSDVFAVLDGETGGSLNVRVGDVIGAYRVMGISSRSVTFESMRDERTLKLWLFGKGPR